MLDGYSVFVRRRQVSRCQGAQLSEQCLGCVPLLRCLSNVLQSVLRGEGFTMTQQCVDRYWGNSGGGDGEARHARFKPGLAAEPELEPWLKLCCFSRSAYCFCSFPC
jgi:hypothetical protein